MTVNEILEELYKSRELDQCIERLVDQSDRRDFKQELFIILFDKPAATVIDLHQSGSLKWYVVRIIMNLVSQQRNVYHKLYKDPAVCYDSDRVADVMDDESEIEARLRRENKELAMIAEIEHGLEMEFGTFYYRSLVELVAKHGSMREVSRQTGIPIASISEAVKKVRNHLNKIYGGEPDKGIY